MEPLLLLLLLFSSIPPARAGGGSQLLIAIAKNTTGVTISGELTTTTTTPTTTADNCSQATATGTLEQLSCSLTEFQSDLQELLLSRVVAFPATNVETWSSRLLKMTWNDAVEVGVKKCTSDQKCFRKFLVSSPLPWRGGRGLLSSLVLT